MLIKDFYTIQSFNSDDNRIKATVLLNPSHFVYKGHFPKQPVVPGVIQIQLLRETAEKALNQKLFISEVSSAKYLSILVPDGMPVLIELTIKAFEDGFKLSGIIQSKTVIFSKIKINVGYPD